MNTINTTKEVKEFCERVGITPAQFTGEDPIKEHLIIEGEITIPSGFAPIVGGSLFLNSITTIPADFAPIVRHHLFLNSVTTIPADFAPIVGGCSYLNSVIILPAGFAPIVGETLYLNSITTIPAAFAPNVGRDLCLDSVTLLPADFAPIVGGTLYLESVTTIPAGFTLTVGGSLWLPKATIPPDFTPTLGGSLYIKAGATAKAKKLDATKPIEVCGGKYIIADGLLTEVVSRRGNVWRVRRVGSDKVFYLVTDGSGNFAHGYTLAEARESLMYKISDRDMSEYEGRSQDSELTFAAAIKMYRTITGACAAGTRHFVASNKIEKKNYTIREIINMTAGQYGHDQLVKFFRS